MQTIDITSWPRQEQFWLLKSFDYPHFSMCANVNITHLHQYIKLHGFSINIAIIYMITRAANSIPEFRYRIRGDQVVEHPVIHPSSTILTRGDLFSFCTFEFFKDFPTFESKSNQRIAHIKDHPNLSNEPNRDDLFYMTAIPWVSFTAFMHPLDMFPVDSIPRFAWGKFFQEDGEMKMPLSVQGHHALMDGIHMGLFYEKIQSYLDISERILE